VKPNQAENSTRAETVSVRAPARLHIGFLDLNASQGRKFGSIGLSVDSHYTEIRVSKSEHNQLSGENLSDVLKQRLEKIQNIFFRELGQHIPQADRQVHIEVKQLIPEHAGLGSGTQLNLTLGKALAELHGLDIDTPNLAKKMGRGKRSGIGIATFDHGGFVVDGGLKPDQTVPPLLLQKPYPENWRIVLVMDPNHQGVHGKNELQAFKTLPIFPLDHVRDICHLTLMQLLPALMEQNIDDFGAAITQIQTVVGDHFAAAQGGRYTSKLVAECLEHAEQLGHKGIAQSSWGPTGCIFVDSDTAAQQLIQTLNETVLAQRESSEQAVFIIARCDNNGASIETSG
jgi:beta-RFAP synthase